jgi:hypothetical protein
MQCVCVAFKVHVTVTYIKVHVTVTYIKVLNVAQQRFYGKLIAPVIMQIICTSF